MTVRMGAMGFVIGVRVLLFVVALAVVTPAKFIAGRLPSGSERNYPRIERLRCWIHEQTVGRLPDCAEYKGSSIVMVRTNYGMEWLDSVVDRIPDSVVRQWGRFGILVMEIFVFIWSAVLLVWLGAAAWIVAGWVRDIVGWALAYDWLSLLQPRAPPDYDVWAALEAAIQAAPEYAMAFGLLIVAFALVVVFWWAIMLPLLPGLTLHEFGHYAAIRKAGASVDSYGLLLFGPLLGGAFVEPGDDAEELTGTDAYTVWSGGIANSVLWGSILIAAGTTMGGDPLTVYAAFFNHGLATLMESPLASFLVLVGGIEVANGFLNAVPVGPVDGGGFIKEIEEEWWGYQDALSRLGIIEVAVDGNGGGPE